MEELRIFEKIEEKIKSNKVFVDPEKSTIANSRIRFAGKNNILFIEDGVFIKNSTICFWGDHSVIYLSASKSAYFVDISAFNNSTVFIGEKNYFNPTYAIVLVAGEQQNIVIGKDGLFSHGIYMRTTDPHLVYDSLSKKRLNRSKSIFVGDHVWIGQNALLLKGTKVGSGAIVGANAVLAGKQVPSNVSVAGNPARVIQKNVFFWRECVNGWTDEITEKYGTMDSEDHIYQAEPQNITFDQLDTELKCAKTTAQRLKYVQELLVGNQEKNRFALKEVKKKRLWPF